MKDLRIFEGLELKNVLIIDNQVYSFAFHLENGIPIVPYMGETDDTELLRIIRYIDWISQKDDLQKYNNLILQLRKIYNSGIQSFIKYYMFDEEEDDDSQP